MNASDTVWACIAVAIGLLVAATTGFDRWHKPRTRRRFQRTARKAARTRSGIFRDLAEAKARREAEQREFEEKFAEIVAKYDNHIPHQRSKEDNQ